MGDDEESKSDKGCGSLVQGIVCIAIWSAAGQAGKACCSQDLTQWLLVSAIVSFSLFSLGAVWSTCFKEACPKLAILIGLASAVWQLAWAVVGIVRFNGTSQCPDGFDPCSFESLGNTSLSPLGNASSPVPLECCDADLFRAMEGYLIFVYVSWGILGLIIFCAVGCMCLGRGLGDSNVQIERRSRQYT